MSTNDLFIHTPRQYRSYAYATKLPQSISMSSIEHRQNTPVATSNRIPISYNRRRTDTSFPTPAPLHSAPTVARCGLTASVSTNDISQPTPRPQRNQFAEIQNATPSRIPSPVTSKSPATLRHASTPVLPSQRKQKENMQPKPFRLLGPISPTRNTHIPKSRTMGMLSSLTSSFSRSSLNIGSRHTSASSARSMEPPTSLLTDSLSAFSLTSSSRHIHTAQLNPYWSGRFQAVNDRLHTEALELSLQDSDIMRQFTEKASPKSKQTKSATMGKKGNEIPKSDKNGQIDIIDTCNDYMNADSNRRIQQVFAHLQELCITSEARRSLWEWQLAFARHEKNENLLPTGGKMVDDRPGWVSRVGRAIIGSSDSTSALGRRTVLSLGRRRVSDK